MEPPGAHRRRVLVGHAGVVIINIINRVGVSGVAGQDGDSLVGADVQWASSRETGVNSRWVEGNCSLTVAFLPGRHFDAGRCISI